jgi:hypothetical protein
MIPNFRRLHRGLTLAFLLGAACLARAQQVTVQFNAGRLYDSSMNPLGDGALVLLLADTQQLGFGTLTSGNINIGDFLPGGLQVIARGVIDSGLYGPATASGTTGAISLSTAPFVNLTTGDPIAIVWFPALTNSSSSYVTGQSYGLFADPGWVVPTAGATVTYDFFTIAAGGSYAETLARANAAAIPEPAAYAALLASAALGMTAWRRRNQRALRRACAVVLVVAGAGSARAVTAEPAAHQTTALVWSTTRIEQRAEIGQERTEVVFPFRNSAAKSVKITAVESSCGCTTARVAKAEYAPGATGEIRAIFEFGDRSGSQQKVLTVHTDDADVATHLVLRVDIPEAIAFDQTVLQWERGEAATPKTIFARVPASGVEITRLGFDPAAVDAQLAPAKSGGGYVITVRPLKTDTGQRQSVRVDAIVAGQARSLAVYAFVR